MTRAKPTPTPSVRERARRNVRTELVLLAQELFVTKGYDQTTVEEIAAAAGMSKRTFFRYVSSKEDLVIGKYEILGAQLAEALAARPHDEPLWQSLRRAFDQVTVYFDDDTYGSRALAMERIIRDHPTLTAGHLERVSRMQDQLLPTVRERTGHTDPADPRPAAIIGAAFSCLLAAQATWLATDNARPFADLLDDAMDALQPR